MHVFAAQSGFSVHQPHITDFFHHHEFHDPGLPIPIISPNHRSPYENDPEVNWMIAIALSILCGCPLIWWFFGWCTAITVAVMLCGYPVILGFYGHIAAFSWAVLCVCAQIWWSYGWVAAITVAVTWAMLLCTYALILGGMRVVTYLGDRRYWKRQRELRQHHNG